MLPIILLCAECEQEEDDFHHTCKFTDCRTPHDTHDFVPGDVSVIGEVEVTFPDNIWD